MTSRRPGGLAEHLVASAEKGSSDLSTELQASLERALHLARELEQSRAAAVASGSERNAQQAATEAKSQAIQLAHMEDLENRLADVEHDRDELSVKLAEYEQQAGRLMNLYVATYQLHATLDPAEVQATIAEIAINLLGAERFVLLFWNGETAECEIALAQGLDQDQSGLYVDGRYGGGDAAVDATLADGVLRIGPSDGSEALAVVPLTVQGATVGALVILRLFGHKAVLRPDDRDLLDLLAAHAASALFAARVYSNTDRKLKTLESLVKLVRRG